MTTTELPPGIYCVYVSLSTGPEYLTRLQDGAITILHPISRKDQEWRIVPGKDGNGIIIEWPASDDITSPASPSYLTYDGSPAKPKSGNQIVVQDSPLNEWHLSPGSGSTTSLIHVAGSDLGITIGPPDIPPILQLGFTGQLEWIFELVSSSRLGADQ